MKLPILSLLLILGSTAAQWKDLRSPMDSPHYQEILHKLFPHLSNRGGIPNGWGKITNGLPGQTRNVKKIKLQSLIFQRNSGSFPSKFTCICTQQMEADSCAVDP